MKRLSLIMLALTFAMPVMAADKNGGYGSYGHSCGKWVDQRKEGAWGERVLMNWLHGYVTAFNSQAADVYSILGSRDWYSVYLWMDKYCQENPLNNIEDGMEELTGELWANRKRTGN